MKQITLTDKELLVLKYMLRQASDTMASAGCNDLPDELVELFSKEEGKQIAMEFAVMNNEPIDEACPWPIPDFCLCHWIMKKVGV